jgi:hypothetical protein
MDTIFEIAKENNIDTTISHINIWETEENEQLNHIHNTIIRSNLLINHSYFLDIDNVNNKLIEQYIIDIALYHLNRLSILDINNYYVEFKLSTTNLSHNFNISESNITPLLSCIVFLNDNKLSPFVFTGIDIETYKFKNFENVNEMTICYPKQAKHISYDCKYYHGYINSCNDTIMCNTNKFLEIKLWSKNMRNKPENTTINSASFGTHEINYQPCLFKDATTQTEFINFDKYVTNFEYLNDILYNRYFYHFFKLHLLLYDKSGHIFKCAFSEKDTINFKRVIEDVRESINISKVHNFKHNRFLQRFTFQNILNNENSIIIFNHIQESITDCSRFPEKGYIVDNSNPIFKVCLISALPILNNTKILYGLHDFRINITKIYIVKYSHEFCNNTNSNNSLLTISVHLKDDISVEGEYCFQDGLSSKLCKGDAIVYSNNTTSYHVLPVKKGNIFILNYDLDIES